MFIVYFFFAGIDFQFFSSWCHHRNYDETTFQLLLKEKWIVQLQAIKSNLWECSVPKQICLLHNCAKISFFHFHTVALLSNLNVSLHNTCRSYIPVHSISKYRSVFHFLVSCSWGIHVMEVENTVLFCF